MSYSEPLSQIRVVAEWWLVNRGCLTRLLIIILVCDSPDALGIEVWELGPNPRRKTRNTPAEIPNATNKIQIDDEENFNPVDASLTIRYAVVFDSAHPSATDIVFSHVLLSELANHYFQLSERPMLRAIRPRLSHGI